MSANSKNLTATPTRRSLLVGGASVAAGALAGTGFSMAASAASTAAPKAGAVHASSKGKQLMSNTIVTKDGTQLYLQRLGFGPARRVQLTAGRSIPTAGTSQMLFFLHRRATAPMAHDRRGHGRSTPALERQ